MSQEIEQSGQETCMDEHRTPVNTKVQMRDTQEKEAGTEHLKHKQRCCQSMQKCNKEGWGPSGSKNLAKDIKYRKQMHQSQIRN